MDNHRYPVDYSAVQVLWYICNAHDKEAVRFILSLQINK